MPEKYRKTIKKFISRMGLQMGMVHCLFICFALINSTAMRLCLDLVLKEKHIVKSSQLLVSPERFYRFRNRNDSLSKYLYEVEDENHLQQWAWIAFYVGYVLTHVFGGVLLKKYGSKIVLTGAILTSAFFTLLTPMVLRQESILGIIVLRCLVGLCEGPIYPSLSALLLEWIPKKDKGKYGVISFSGVQMGSFLIQFFWYDILQKSNCQWIFFVCSFCSLIWMTGFWILCSDKPEQNYYITNEEKKIIKKNRRASAKNKERPKWQDYISSPSTWSLFLASIQHDWNEINVNFVSLYETAKKNFNDRKSKVSETFFLNVATWMLSITAGYMSDYLINSEILDGPRTKQLISGISLLAPNLVDKIIEICDCKNCSTKEQLIQCAIKVLGTYYAGITDFSALPLAMCKSLPEFYEHLNLDELTMNFTHGTGTLINAFTPLLASFNIDARALKDFETLLWFVCSILLPEEFQQKLKLANIPNILDLSKQTNKKQPFSKKTLFRKLKSKKGSAQVE